MRLIEQFINFFNPGERAKAKGFRRNRAKAQQGDAWAQERVGKAYEFGQGIEQDYTKAVSWYRKAAEQGRPSAQSKLGRMFENGRGVPRDLQEALKWYNMAVEGGDMMAAQSRDAIANIIAENSESG